MRGVRFSALMGTLFSLIVAPLSYGAQQLRNGATTSAQPTAALGTALRTLQITFDPDVQPAAVADGAPLPSYNVTSFQLSVKYDASKLTVSNSDIQFIDPYTQSLPITGSPSAGSVQPLSGTASNAFIDTETGTISFISGAANVGNTHPGDVNIFSINFHLNTSTLSTQLLTFTIFANPLNNDFIQGTDPNNPNPLTNTATSTDGAVVPTTITNSFNGFAAQIANGSSVPLPAGSLPCGVMLALLGGYHYRRQRAA